MSSFEIFLFLSKYNFKADVLSFNKEHLSLTITLVLLKNIKRNKKK